MENPISMEFKCLAVFWGNGADDEPMGLRNKQGQ